MILGFARLEACLLAQRLQNRTPRHLNPRCRQTVVKDADRRFRLVRHYYVLPAKPRKNKEPTSGLEPLTCSLRVIHQALQGFARGCKCPLFRGISLLCLASCCTVLRSRWYQSGINGGIAASRSCSVVVLT